MGRILAVLRPFYPIGSAVVAAFGHCQASVASVNNCGMIIAS